MFFASDNTGPAHPKVMEALQAANAGHVAPYGDDALTAEVVEGLRALFEAPVAAVYLVATGTACNALLLATMTRPWETIFCSEVAHIVEDECGAPEFFADGARLTPVKAPDGLLDPDDLERKVAETAQGAVRSLQRGPLSLTTVTERGTVYTLDELRRLTSIAARHGIKVHLDGARLANAAVALGCSPADLTWRSGIDAVSFGGTKNGLLSVEAAIIFDPALAWEFELRRKRSGHLVSKHRYLAAQMQAYLAGDLWREMAAMANGAATRLARGIEASPHARLAHPPMANVVYCEIEGARLARLREHGAAFYAIGPEHGAGAGAWRRTRLVCDWSATDADTDRFLSLLDG